MVSDKKSNLTTAVPQLPALDLAVSTLFYRDVLGFSLAAEYPGFAIFKRDSVEIHLWFCDEPLVAANSSCYLRVENIEAIYAELTAHKVTVQEPLAVRPWGMKQFSILDPSGNALRFGEPAEE